MRTIKFIKSVENYKLGDILVVENNTAHRYIDREQAVLVDSLNYNKSVPKNITKK